MVTRSISDLQVEPRRREFEPARGSFSSQVPAMVVAAMASPLYGPPKAAPRVYSL
jgi:hypothetical protein